MKLIQLLNCAFGKHERSGSKARRDGATMRSRCRGCGRPMVRTFSGWVIDTDADSKAGSPSA